MSTLLVFAPFVTLAIVGYKWTSLSLFLFFLITGLREQAKQPTLKDIRLRLSANANCATICHKSLVITFDATYFQKLTNLEQNAVAWHELAHVKYKHNGLERSYENELSCDLLAAKKVSYAAIISALQKIDDKDEEINDRIRALTKLSLQ